MRPAPEAAPAAVYLLADNLDALLAAGEDILKAKLSWQSGNTRPAEEIAAKRREEREALVHVRTLETVLIAKALKAREYAYDLAAREVRMKPVAKLFVAGTAALKDAVSEIANPAAVDFDTGDVATAYLRKRGLIAADAPAPAEAATVTPTEAFLVAGRAPLGILMDLVAMTLDTLETHYDLYDESRRSAYAILAGDASSAAVGA